MMKICVAVTDWDWLKNLSALTANLTRPERDKQSVNFWRPGRPTEVHVIGAGDLLLFKTRGSHNKIVGGGFFYRHDKLKVSEAWWCFGEANGFKTQAALLNKILSLRSSKLSLSDSSGNDPLIGCTLLNQPVFFLDNGFETVNFNPHGSLKTYHFGSEDWLHYYAEWESRLQQLKIINIEQAEKVAEETFQVHPQMLEISKRPSQGSFRADVKENCGGECVVSQEKVLVVLDAAHIQPYSTGQDNSVNNGLLLRADIHRLYDSHLVTVTPEYNFLVNDSLLDYGNGRQYLELNDRQIRLPQSAQKLNREYLAEHHEKFKARL